MDTSKTIGLYLGSSSISSHDRPDKLATKIAKSRWKDGISVGSVARSYELLRVSMFRGGAVKHSHRYISSQDNPRFHVGCLHAQDQTA